MKGGLGNMMRQVQQMQAKMEKVQAELETLEVEGASGGGMVKVTMNAKSEVKGITIDPSVVDKDDVDMLQDLVLAAFNAAHEKAQEIQQEKMSAVTGGLNIPGLNLPF